MSSGVDTSKGISFSMRKFSIGTFEIKRKDISEKCVTFSEETIRLYVTVKSGDRRCVKLRPSDLIQIEYSVVTKCALHTLLIQTTQKKTKEIQKICSCEMDYNRGAWYDPRSKEESQRRILLILDDNSLEKQAEIKKVLISIEKSVNVCKEFQLTTLDWQNVNEIMLMVSQAIIKLEDKDGKKGRSTVVDPRIGYKRPLENQNDTSVSKHLRSRENPPSGSSNVQDKTANADEELNQKIKGFRAVLADKTSNISKLKQQMEELEKERNLAELKHKEEIGKAKANMESLKEITETVQKELRDTLAEKEALQGTLAKGDDHLKETLEKQLKEHKDETEAMVKKYTDMLSSSKREKVEAEKNLKASQDDLQECQKNLQECQESLKKSQESVKEWEKKSTESLASLCNLRASVCKLLMLVVPDLEQGTDIKVNSEVDDMLKEIISQAESIG
ncbi:DNA ligase 1-like [Ptychodera flava]|uniref:DNA ligase 1-like n=1 Tax=Ptychodera flava TaxID=63121 RepID=UPI00396A2195